METERHAHWEAVWSTKTDDQVSWFQDMPAPSLDLIRHTGVPREAAIVDVGGGAGRLVDHLLDAGFADLTVLDLSPAALGAAQARLGPRAAGVDWVAADVTRWPPGRRYDLWHDRAAFHFLTAPEDRAAYSSCVDAAVNPGGWVIIGTFAPDGPETCSGLPVMRQDANAVGACLGSAFTLARRLAHMHRTPGGARQSFEFGLFRKAG